MIFTRPRFQRVYVYFGILFSLVVLSGEQGYSQPPTLEESAHILFQKHQMYNQPELYQYLESLEPAQMLRLIEQWYPEHSSNLVDKISRNLGVRYLGLLADPGIVSHIDSFIPFANSARLASNPNLFELRSEFSKKLGTKTVYRALVLSEDELKTVRENGIEPPGLFYQKEEALVAYERVLGKSETNPETKQMKFAYGPLEEVANRVGKHDDSRKWSMYQSCTAFPEVAISVAIEVLQYYFSFDVKRLVYLLELRIPELSLIYKKGPFVSYEKKEKMDHRYLEIPDRKFRKYYLDPGVEIFVPHQILPSQIVQVAPVLDLTGYGLIIRSIQNEKELSLALVPTPGK